MHVTILHTISQFDT
ncbi:hypothetical protein F383_36293 [Gossypium arboreum]|uniref:Uncharacterized protein n=1 Tax=Gossypium arboreum TaxID=29729 RepID=A0A0B0NCZ3_GOSAR|nr:hypothetical protein F383_36293 [Gossypium arboreum]